MKRYLLQYKVIKKHKYFKKNILYNKDKILKFNKKMISFQKVIKDHTYFIFNNDNRLIKTHNIQYIVLTSNIFLFITCYRLVTKTFLNFF